MLTSFAAAMLTPLAASMLPLLALLLSQTPTGNPAKDFPAPAPAKAASPQAPAEAEAPAESLREAKAALKAMQAFYEKAKDCRADFQQTYVNQAFHKTLHSTGTLRFKRPGLLRFDYVTPEPKFFVVKKDRFTTYMPAARQAMVGSFKADQLSASVTFLFGKGKLENEFNVAPSDRTDLGPGIAMLLVPKRDDQRLSRIYFVVDPVTSAVRQSVVVDQQGNENRFDFSNIHANVGLTEKDFDDSLPAGTQVVGDKAAPQ